MIHKFSQSSKETIQKAQAGDENAIAQVIEENMGLITAELIKWGYVPESEDFEDTVSDIKVEMINRVIPQYEFSRGAFSTFLTTAIYNFLRRGTRKKDYKEMQQEVSLTEPTGEDITIGDTLEAPVEGQVTVAGAREHLQKWFQEEAPDLEEMMLRIFDLKVLGYSNDKIAEILNEEGYADEGKSITRAMVNNYVNKYIKSIMQYFLEAFKSASLSMQKKAQEESPLQEAIKFLESKKYLKDSNPAFVFLKENISVNALIQLSKNENYKIRQAVARHMDTPPETLAKLAKDENYIVRIFVVRNVNTTPNILAELARDSDEHIRMEVAHHTTSSQVLTELAKDEDVGVRWNVAYNPNTSSELLAELVEEAGVNPNIWHCVYQHPNVSEETKREIDKKREQREEEIDKMFAKDPLAEELTAEEPGGLAYPELDESWLEEEEKVKKEILPETERTEKIMEVPYAELLNKYTEDEIWDIASGKKTDVTEEEIEQAKYVISKGIVASRLSMRKKGKNE